MTSNDKANEVEIAAIKVIEKEAEKIFDTEFIELARSVYAENDKRSELKREINLKCKSDLFEEKEYSKY